MELPPWLLAVGAGGISAPGLWGLVKWFLEWRTNKTAADKQTEGARIAAISEREERASAAMERALTRLDADVQRLSAESDASRERIVKLEQENRAIRSRFDRLDRAVRIALSRLHDLMRWEEAGMPPPPPWTIKSIADLLTEDKDKE